MLIVLVGLFFLNGIEATGCEPPELDTIQHICKKNENFTQFNDPECAWTDFDMNYTVVNTTFGTIKVQLEFPHESCKNCDFELRLVINEGATRENCEFSVENSTENSEENMFEHSTVEYTGKETCEKCQNCTDVAEIEYGFVFSGCYALEIKRSTEDKTYRSKPAFIETEYEKNLKNFMEGTIQNKIDLQEIKINFSTGFSTKRPNIFMSLYKGDDTCYGDGIMDASSKFIFTNYTNDNYSFSCHYPSDYLYMCTFHGLKPGPYSIKFGVINENPRCNLLTISGNRNCVQRFSLNVTNMANSTSVTTKLEQASGGIPNCLVIFGVVLILMGSFIFYHVKIAPRRRMVPGNRRNEYSVVQEIQISQNLSPTLEILIVYARETVVFQNMIRSFVEVLQTEGNVKVYDICSIDDSKIYEAPEEWLRKKITNPEVITILFLNECGTVQFDEPSKVILPYRYPKWTDGLFLYSLRLLAHETAKTYSNFFVVSLSNVVHDISAFKHFNLAARYSLPVNLEQLLQRIFDRKINVNCAVWSSFVENCTGCVNFYRSNPNYLNDILYTDC